MTLLIILGIGILLFCLITEDGDDDNHILTKIICVAVIIIPILIWYIIAEIDPIVEAVIFLVALLILIFLFIKFDKKFDKKYKKENQNNNTSAAMDNSTAKSSSDVNSNNQEETNNLSDNSTPIDIEEKDGISDNHTHTITEKARSIPDTNTPRNGTSFQDELKFSLVTPEELEAKETKRITDIAYSKAMYVLECAKEELLNQSKNGHYIEIENTKYIECYTNLSPDYKLNDFLHIKKAGTIYNPVYTYSIDKEHKRMYGIFISKLQELANEEGISIFPVVFNSLTRTELPIPSSSTTSGFLTIKCRCRVPDKYSSDIPIYTNNIPESVEPHNNEIEQNDEVDIDTMEGHNFEFFCADLLRKNGFKNVSVTQGSGDQGIDIIAFKDDIKYGIQCKCYSTDIGNKAVQEAFSGKTFYQCHIGAVLTNRYFTRSAHELAKNNGIILWDRSKLLSFMETANRKNQ